MTKQQRGRCSFNKNNKEARSKKKTEYEDYYLSVTNVKWAVELRQQSFNDSGSDIDVVDKTSAIKDDVIIIHKDEANLRVVDFSGNGVEMIGHTV